MHILFVSQLRKISTNQNCNILNLTTIKFRLGIKFTLTNTYFESLLRIKGHTKLITKSHNATAVINDKL